EPERVAPTPSTSDVLPPELEQIVAAVAGIPNDDFGWGGWNRIAMAVYAATEGSAEGYESAGEWSRKAGKYNERNTVKKWEALHRSPPVKIGVGTIFWLADRADPDWRVRFEMPYIEMSFDGVSDDVLMAMEASTGAGLSSDGRDSLAGMKLPP